MSPEAKEEIRTIKKNTVSLILLCDKYMVLIKLCFRHFICIEEESDVLPPFLLTLSESSRHGAGKG